MKKIDISLKNNNFKNFKMNTLKAFSVILCIFIKFLYAENIFIHWNEIVNTTNSKIYVEINNINNKIDYVGIGFNYDIKMKNATMVIFKNINNTWNCDLYKGKEDNFPEYIMNYNCSYQIYKNNFLGSFKIDLPVKYNYIFYAYSSSWGFHGNKTGISWKPKETIVFNNTNPIIFNNTNPIISNNSIPIISNNTTQTSFSTQITINLFLISILYVIMCFIFQIIYTNDNFF